MQRRLLSLSLRAAPSLPATSSSSSSSSLSSSSSSRSPPGSLRPHPSPSTRAGSVRWKGGYASPGITTRNEGMHYAQRDPEITRRETRTIEEDEDELRALLGKRPKPVDPSLPLEDQVLQYSRKTRRVFPEAPLLPRMPGSSQKTKEEDRPLAKSLHALRLQTVKDLIRTQPARDELKHMKAYRDLNTSTADVVVPEAEGIDQRWKQRMVDAVRREMQTVDNNWNTQQKEEVVRESLGMIQESDEDKAFRRFVLAMQPPPQ
jgi:hypothetical protein